MLSWGTGGWKEQGLAGPWFSCELHTRILIFSFFTSMTCQAITKIRRALHGYQNNRWDDLNMMDRFTHTGTDYLISRNSSELALSNFRRDWKLQLSHQQVLCQEVFIQVANFVYDDVRYIWVLFQPLVHAHPYSSGCHWPQPEHRQGAEGDGWWQAHVCPPQAEAWEEVLCEGYQGWEGLRLEKHPGILDCQGRVG